MTNTSKRYPVIYFNDAQNIFEGWKAPFGVGWEVHNSMLQLRQEGFQEAILIGIEHGRKHRQSEYVPLNRNGKFLMDGNHFSDFIANDLKPFVDKKLRTIPWRENTAIVGSSLGAISALYTGLKHQDVFSKIGAFSPSFWIIPPLYDLTLKVGKHYDTQLFLSCGAQEGQSTINNTKNYYHTLIKAGYNESEIFFLIKKNGKHNELLWQSLFRDFYKWSM